MKHRIYIAAPSEYWDRAQILADAIAVELGEADIVSRWHRNPVEKYPEDVGFRTSQLAMNVDGLERATVVIVLCDAGTPRSTFADAGYALGRGLPVLWVAGRTPSQQCLFDVHRLVRIVESAPTLELAARIARIIERELDLEVA